MVGNSLIGQLFLPGERAQGPALCRYFYPVRGMAAYLGVTNSDANNLCLAQGAVPFHGDISVVLGFGIGLWGGILPQGTGEFGAIPGQRRVHYGRTGGRNGGKGSVPR